jgi:uncharacterized protein (DUF427 family)
VTMTEGYRAIWNDAVLANSTDAAVVDGNVYLRLQTCETTPSAERVRPRIAFWGGVKIEADRE